MLSHYIGGGLELVISISRKREKSQITTEAVVATTLYPASVEDRETERCLQEHHEIAFDARKTTYAPVEVRSS